NSAAPATATAATPSTDGPSGRPNASDASGMASATGPATTKNRPARVSSTVVVPVGVRAEATSSAPAAMQNASPNPGGTPVGGSGGRGRCGVGHGVRAMSKVTGVRSPTGGRHRGGDGGQEQPGQGSENGAHHRQFDECEGGAPRHGREWARGLRGWASPGAPS